MEAGMSQSNQDERAGTGLAAAHNLLSRLREWWARGDELRSMDPAELERVAHDLGMTGPDLKHLAARGPDASRLLYERMRLLGLTRSDVEQLAQGLMRDLERTCACCGDKGVCERDLAAQ